MKRPRKNNRLQLRGGGNPEYLNPETLLQEYYPLMMSIQKRFSGYYSCYSTEEAKEDLWSNIQMEFLILLREYDYTSGIDFPGYIKKTLQNRVYNRHVVVDKRNMETPNSDIWNSNQFSSGGEDFENQEYHHIVQQTDESAELAFQNVLAAHSVPWELFGETEQEFIRMVLHGESVAAAGEKLGISQEKAENAFEEIINALVEWHKGGH